MAGLLGGKSVGGLLGTIGTLAQRINQSPEWQDLALNRRTGDPMAAERARMMRAEEERARREAEIREQQLQMQIDQQAKAQERQQYTQALLTAGSSQNPALLQDPTFQAQLRQKAAAYGDPQALEQGGLLAPMPTATKAPDKVQMYEFAKQQGYGGSFMDFLQQDASTGANAGQYFSGVTVKMPDGSYAVVQPGNKPGMGVNTVPLPGAPLTYDPAVAAAIAAAQASGKVTGEASGTREKNAPDFAITMRELENVSTDGGLIDQSTGSGFGAAADKGAGLFGIATEGAKAIAQLAPLADRVLKTVPRFEGPQSDKDTQSYREAAGQLNDPTKPPEIRKAAAREILRLMRERQGQFMSTEDAGWGIVK